MENIALPSLYYAHKRRILNATVLFYPIPFITLREGEEVGEEIVRFRTMGDATITGATDLMQTPSTRLYKK